MRCIYCLKTDGTFSGREHVIPQFLGTFTPKNLLLKPVCNGCNSIVFSKFETVFKEDSVEGLIAAQFRLRNDSSIRFRNERMKINKRISGEQRIFDETFPFLDPVTGRAIPVPHVIIEGKNGKTLILLLKGITERRKRNLWKCLRMDL